MEKASVYVVVTKAPYFSAPNVFYESGNMGPFYSFTHQKCFGYTSGGPDALFHKVSQLTATSYALEKCVHQKSSSRLMYLLVRRISSDISPSQAVKRIPYIQGCKKHYSLWNWFPCRASSVLITTSFSAPSVDFHLRNPCWLTGSPLDNSKCFVNWCLVSFSKSFPATLSIHGGLYNNRCAEWEQVFVFSRYLGIHLLSHTV